MPCDRYEMPRRYTHIVFDPPSAHYVGASAITVPFQIYDEEGEILLGPEGKPHDSLCISPQESEAEALNQVRT